MPITGSRSTKTQSNVQLTDADIRMHQQELGLIGRLTGGEKMTVITLCGFCIFLCLFGMMLIIFIPHENKQISDSDTVKGLLALVASIFSFLAGFLSAGGRSR